ncbi:hypothetical protein MRX96_002437 [Rhipicephalus microplus]
MSVRPGVAIGKVGWPGPECQGRDWRSATTSVSCIKFGRRAAWLAQKEVVIRPRASIAAVPSKRPDDDGEQEEQTGDGEQSVEAEPTAGSMCSQLPKLKTRGPATRGMPLRRTAEKSRVFGQEQVTVLRTSVYMIARRDDPAKVYARLCRCRRGRRKRQRRKFELSKLEKQTNGLPPARKEGSEVGLPAFEEIPAGQARFVAAALGLHTPFRTRGYWELLRGTRERWRGDCMNGAALPKGAANPTGVVETLKPDSEEMIPGELEMPDLARFER